MDTKKDAHGNGDYRPIEGPSGGRTLATTAGLDPRTGRPVLPTTDRPANLKGAGQW